MLRKHIIFSYIVEIIYFLTNNKVVEYIKLKFSVFADQFLGILGV